MLSGDIKLKVLPDGSVVVERRDDEHNSAIYDALCEEVKDRKDLADFLFRWKGREVIFGDSSLCG